MSDEDKNLLELAAKAAGLKDFRYCPEEDLLHDYIEYKDAAGYLAVWMPHLDDGDALRLAVKLGLTLVIESDMVFCRNQRSDKAFCERGSDRNAATRRAIVRAAAEVGKSMTRTAESVDPILQMIRDQEAKKNALIAEGICPTCKGEGECGGQFQGGEYVCEDCNGSGRTK